MAVKLLSHAADLRDVQLLLRSRRYDDQTRLLDLENTLAIGLRDVAVLVLDIAGGIGERYPNVAGVGAGRFDPVAGQRQSGGQKLRQPVIHEPVVRFLVPGCPDVKRHYVSSHADSMLFHSWVRRCLA